MDADIKGSLAKINKVWPMFEHNGKSMTKEQVKAVLEYGLSKGYDAVSQISGMEISIVLDSINPPPIG